MRTTTATNTRLPTTKTAAMNAAPRTRRHAGVLNIKADHLSSRIPLRADSLESTSSEDDNQNKIRLIITEPVPSTTAPMPSRATPEDSDDNSLRSSLESQRQIIEEIALMNYSDESLALPETTPPSPLGRIYNHANKVNSNPNAPPPSYNSQDGTESLPPYTSTLDLACVLDIKHEMDNPFEMSTDKWAPFLCVLTGTKIDIYHTRSRTMSRLWNKKPKKGPLFASWSLLHAQVGRADDYVKKANVVRLRIAAVQVLIACPTVEFMGEFIRLILASTGISLAIDLRADVETGRDPASLQHMPANRHLRKNVRAACRLQDDIDAAIALEESLEQSRAQASNAQEPSNSSSRRPRNRDNQPAATEFAPETTVSTSLESLPGNASTIQEFFIGMDRDEMHSLYHRLTRYQRATVRRLCESSDAAIGRNNKFDWSPMWYSGTRETDYIRAHLPTLKKSHATQNTEIYANFGPAGAPMTLYQIDRERKILIAVEGKEVVKFEGKKARKMDPLTWKEFLTAKPMGTIIPSEDGAPPPYDHGFMFYSGMSGAN